MCSEAHLSDVGLVRLKRHAAATREAAALAASLPKVGAAALRSACDLWAAPELQADPGMNPTRKSDVWAFGTTAWEVLTGSEPYAAMPQCSDAAVISAAIACGKTPADFDPWPPTVPSRAVEVVTRW